MGTAWVPDGRAVAIRQHCEASLAVLDGVGIDLYLLHAPDPRVPWLTSVRALARLLEDGLVPRVGLSNVNRGQLDAALAVVPVAAVEVTLSPFDDAAVRGRASARESLAWVLFRSPVVVAIASCPHPGGPPAWCRPPLPGLVLAFCHHHGVDPARSVLVGTTSRHRALATAVGARFTRPG